MPFLNEETHHPPIARGPMRHRNRDSFTPKEKLMRALQKGKRYKFRTLREICGVSQEQLRHLIDNCRRDGMRIIYGRLDRCFYLSTTATPYSDAFDMTWLPKKGKLGLISDTHLCSDADRVDLCEKAYSRFAEEGIETVLHAGDKKLSPKNPNSEKAPTP